MKIQSRQIVLVATLFGLAGCVVGDTFDIVELRRDADGAEAVCSSGTYGVNMSGQSKNPPPNVTRCVAACEKAGFVFVKSFPRSDLVIETKGLGDIPESECTISRKS